MKHRRAGGRLPDRLSDPFDQIKVFAFLETIDAKTVPFVPLDVRPNGNQIILGFDPSAARSMGSRRAATLPAHRPWSPTSTAPASVWKWRSPF